MDKETLVDRDIDDGRRVVQGLDKAAFPVVAAFWNLLPDESEWRLVIASPKVNELGPRQAYAAIQAVLQEQHIPLRLLRISAVPHDDHLATELRVFAGTEPAPFIGGAFLQKVVIGDRYVEGAFVYRAERMIGKTGTFEVWAADHDRDRDLWVAYPLKVIVESDFFKKIEARGKDWRQTNSRVGLNAHLGVLDQPRRRNGHTVADIQRWTILHGRLRHVETVARDARIEGYNPARRLKPKAGAKPKAIPTDPSSQADSASRS